MARCDQVQHWTPAEVTTLASPPVWQQLTFTDLHGCTQRRSQVFAGLTSEQVATAAAIAEKNIIKAAAGVDEFHSAKITKTARTFCECLLRTPEAHHCVRQETPHTLVAVPAAEEQQLVRKLQKSAQNCSDRGSELIIIMATVRSVLLSGRTLRKKLLSCQNFP